MRTGAQWEELPRRYGTPSTCWRRLKKWQEDGTWDRIWKAFLGQLDKEDKLDWTMFYMDGSFASAKKRGQKVGLTKKGKGTKWMVITDKRGIPVTVITESAQKSEFQLAIPTVNQIEVPRRPCHPKKNPDALCADKGYDSKAIREALRKKGITPIIPKRRRKGQKEQPHYNKKIKPIYRFRGTVERTIVWMGWSRRLLIRWERSDTIYQAFINLACIMICLKQVLK